MKLLVFGAHGQVGRELARLPGVTALARAEADLLDPERCAGCIAETQADVVINAAAYTAVDRAEEEETLAQQINGVAPGHMARAAAARNLPFLHVSTDYVFAGDGTAPHQPDDPTAPRNAYGRSKLAGERAVRAADGPHAILRTSWVFSAHGTNFVKTMLQLSQRRDALKVVDDQIGGPTPAADIAATLHAMAHALHADTAPRQGTWHYAGAPATGWDHFARETFALARRNVSVTGIPTSAWPTAAERPLNSRLDGTTLARDFGIKQSDWKAGLARVIKELETAA